MFRTRPIKTGGSHVRKHMETSRGLLPLKVVLEYCPMFPRSDAFSCLISCKQSVKFLLGKIGSTHRCCSIFRTGVYQLTLGSPQPCTLALCRRFSASTCLHTLEKAWPPASSQALRVVLRACTCARVARGIRTDGMSRINATHTHTAHHSGKGEQAVRG